ILRTYKNKEFANIYDVIVLPSTDTPKMAEIELRRFYEYARLAENKDMSGKFLRIKVLSADGDKINLNLPLALIELFLSNEGIMSGMSFGGNMDDAFKKIDFKQIYNMVSMGVMGKLVEVNSADGDIVEVWVE
ncbi:MAG: hypothetical protein IKW16_02195, partial [Clostridia bacterium]|nr:hypothetical protein [Clostridia bacterium]